MSSVASACHTLDSDTVESGYPHPAGPATLGDLLDSGRGLVATCEVCLHSAVLDLPDLAARHGRGHSCSQEALRPRLQCSVCKSVEPVVREAGPDDERRMARKAAAASIPIYV